MRAVGFGVCGGVLVLGAGCFGGGGSSSTEGGGAPTMEEIPGPGRMARQVGGEDVDVEALLEKARNRPRPVLPGDAAPVAGDALDPTRRRGVRGRLSRSPDGASITPCSDKAEIPLADPKGLLKGASMPDGTPAYAELWIEGPASGATVAALLTADPSGATRGCSAPPRSGWTAQGNEPFWSLSLTPSGTVIKTPEWTTELGPATRQEETLVAKGADDTLVVQVQPVPCTDDMAGTRFGHTISFRWDGRAYRGCAAAPLDPSTVPLPRSGPIEPGPEE